ncbi:MAG: hypothetical protein JWO44_965 [Bacteroidetes bacterium]|nr:hypothetical protein [Bacteroidota bacterium]
MFIATMIHINQTILIYSVTALAAVTGIIVFRKLQVFFKLLLLQVVLYLMGDRLGIKLKPDPNAWVYNVLALFETLLLFLAAQVYFNSKRSRLVLQSLFFIFLIVFFIDFFLYDIFKIIFYHAVITEGLFFSAISITILYFQFRKAKTHLDTAIIVAVIGMLIYFACSTPYLCLISYIQKFDKELNKKLFQYIVVDLAGVRYMLIAIAFFIAGRRKTLSPAN